jgi:hypothetical protein
MTAAATETPAVDWRAEIGDVAQHALTTEGAVIVRLASRAAPLVVSRLYRAADYTTSDGRRDPRKLRQVAWARASRIRNQDPTGSNYYVVTRHSDNSIVVWHAIDGVLHQSDATATSSNGSNR